MNVIDKIPFNQEHKWEITKDGVMFHVTVLDEWTKSVVARVADDTLSTALCMAQNRIRVEEGRK